MLGNLSLKMDFPEFYKELEAEFWGASAKLMGLQLLQLELRLGVKQGEDLGSTARRDYTCQLGHCFPVNKVMGPIRFKLA
ncbi:hypothetical protein Tco_0536365 [Tanacetum coccineum]